MPAVLNPVAGLGAFLDGMDRRKPIDNLRIFADDIAGDLGPAPDLDRVEPDVGDADLVRPDRLTKLRPRRYSATSNHTGVVPLELTVTSSPTAMSRIAVLEKA